MDRHTDFMTKLTNYIFWYKLTGIVNMLFSDYNLQIMFFQLMLQYKSYKRGYKALQVINKEMIF